MKAFVKWKPMNSFALYITWSIGWLLHNGSFHLKVFLSGHVIIFSWFTNIFSDLSYVSSLDILSSYFISFIVWIADIGQVDVNVILIIALIINFTF